MLKQEGREAMGAMLPALVPLAGWTLSLTACRAVSTPPQVSPVTHSIGNCIKRVVVIVASVIAFQNPVSAQNAFGEPRSDHTLLITKPHAHVSGSGRPCCEPQAGSRGADLAAVARTTSTHNFEGPRASPLPALLPCRSPPHPPGTGLALFGVFLYSQAKRRYK